MTEAMATTQQTGGAGGTGSDDARMQTLLTTYKMVGMPLLQALTESTGRAPGSGGVVIELNNEVFNTLVDSAIMLSRTLAGQVGASDAPVDSWVRWSLAGAAAQMVASHFKVTSRPLSEESAQKIADIAEGLQGKFGTLMGGAQEPVPNTIATFRAKMMEAMVPVVGAMAQYSFGRSEHALLAEVADKLVKTADQVTRALAPAGSSAEQWRLLCWHVLKAAGQVYTESHYAEADRLLYMNPDERAAYFAQHGNVPPMSQVWQAFNQRMAMLATLASYLDVPEAAKLDIQGWL
ncbi:MAG: hypothetical protein JO126_01375 [Alphaproteobacteria bacterium]|nr:hypothetical protein [Alphaproteobacteria bacterium]MBV8548088.1 hypothetical protein [Alphaproteobacteria bacterium]